MKHIRCTRSLPLVLLSAISFLLAACSPSLPQHAKMCLRKPHLSVDNDSATLPPNISPMNFRIKEQGEEYLSHFWSEADRDGLVVEGPAVMIDEDDWHALLQLSKGKTLYCDIYVKKDGKWSQYEPVVNDIASDDIDPYITYRLIEPGYVDYEEMSINQRSLTSFEEKQVYNNMMLSDGDNGQCVNCHVPRNYNREERSMFHVRQFQGGTVFIQGDRVSKVNLKTDSTLSAGVYPAWNPTKNLVAFSVNETGQLFRTRDPQKVEVIDFASDLILYDIDHNTVYDIDKRKDEFESFPSWSPDGQTLYYVSAHYEQKTKSIDNDLGEDYQQLKYNIYCRTFDSRSMRFGDRQLVFDAAAMGKSAAFPRVSPDGRYLLFSLGDYGQFHVWHKSGDLWALDLKTGMARALTAANSKDVESYHTWSSNGRWLLFTSRRGDGNYTRLYMAYFDRQGRVHKPFLLPQEDPDRDQNLLKSYNTPEFLVRPVKADINGLTQGISRPATQARYGGSALLHPDGGYDVTKADSLDPSRQSVAY